MSSDYGKYKAEFQSVVDRLDTLAIADVYEQETGWSLNRHRQGPCPFCGSGTHGTKSSDGAFTVYPAKNFALCYSCGKSTNVVGLIMHLHNLDYKHAIHYIAEAYFHIRLENPYEKISFQVKRREWKPRKKPTAEEIKKEEEERRKLFEFLRDQALENGRSKAEAYLSSRGIKTELLPKTAFYQHEEYKDMPAGVVFFDSEKKLLNKRHIGEVPAGRGKSFNFGFLRNAVYDETFDAKQDIIYTCEGVINAMSFATLGKSAIAMFSSHNIPDNVAKFRKYFENRYVVIAYDYDRAGLKGAIELAKWIIENFQVKAVKLMMFPEGKDANDLLQEGTLSDHIANVRNMVEPRVSELAEELRKIKADREYIPYVEFRYYSYQRLKQGIDMQYRKRENSWQEGMEDAGIVPVEYVTWWSNGFLHRIDSGDEFPVYLLQDDNVAVIWEPKARKPMIVVTEGNGIYGLGRVQSEIERIRSEREAKDIVGDKEMD